MLCPIIIIENGEKFEWIVRCMSDERVQLENEEFTIQLMASFRNLTKQRGELGISQI